MESIPVEIWSKIISYLYLNDLFQFLNASKFFFDVAQSDKLFVEKKRILKHILSYVPDFFDFVKRELKILRKECSICLEKMIFYSMLLIYAWKKITYDILAL